MENIIHLIRQDLKNSADEKTRAVSERFFKEEIVAYGVKSATVHKISKAYFKHIHTKSKSEIFTLCETLWQSGYIEESFIACHWSHNLHKQYVPDDFPVFERWINHYVSNWATCDTLCNHTVGDFIQMYPAYISKLKDFARSDNRWTRRAAAVSLIVPARKGKFLKEIFEIADILLPDKDDLVQKGYGWMLKSASQADQKAVFEYVVKNKAIMPRTALRYAIEKMPGDLRNIAMERK
jgi:3-methyladenine DNA glycosylase AlkD